MKITLILLSLLCASCSGFSQQQYDDTPLQAISTDDLLHPVCGVGW